MITRSMAKRAREIDKHAKDFAKCAFEIQLEFTTAHREFRALKFLQSFMSFDLQLESNPIIINLFKHSIYYLNPLSWWHTINNRKQACGDTEVFGEAEGLSEVCDNFSTLLALKLWDDNRDLNVDQLELFVEELEKNIYYYMAGVQKAPQLYHRFQDLPQNKQQHIKEQAARHDILLDDFRGGILMHLVQHVCRIPLLLKDLEKHASETSFDPIQVLSNRIALMQQGTNQLLEIINQDSAKPKLTKNS